MMNMLDLTKLYLAVSPIHIPFIHGHSSSLGETFSLYIKLIIILPFALLSVLFIFFSFVAIVRTPLTQYHLILNLNPKIIWTLFAIAMVASTILTCGATFQIYRRIAKLKTLEKLGVLVAGTVTTLVHVKKSGQTIFRDYEISFYTPEHIKMQTIVRLRGVSPNDIQDMIGIQAAVLYVSPTLFEVL